MSDKVVRRLFVVLGFEGGPNCGGICEIKIDGGRVDLVRCGTRRRIGETGPPLSAVKRVLACSEKRDVTVVGKMVGSDICLMASYLPGADQCHFCFQPPVVFNTENNDLKECLNPLATQGFLSTFTMGRTLYTPLPSQHHSMYVKGYSVIFDIILISLVDSTDEIPPEFFSSSNAERAMNGWLPVPKIDPSTQPFNGKCEFVDGFVYNLLDHDLLVAYAVTFSNDHLGILSLGPQVIIGTLTYPGMNMRLNPFSRPSSAMVYLGDGVFCFVRTQWLIVGYLKPQHLAIIVLRISDTKLPDKSTAFPSSVDEYPFSICDLDLREANVVSLFADSQEGQHDYKSECWTGLLKSYSATRDFDPLKLESAPEGSRKRKRGIIIPMDWCPSFTFPGARSSQELIAHYLKQLDLEKYSTVFKDIDRATFGRMTDEDLKDLGLKKGARKRLLVLLQL